LEEIRGTSDRHRAAGSAASRFRRVAQEADIGGGWILAQPGAAVLLAASFVGDRRTVLALERQDGGARLAIGAILR
jgi:hypothetical protein